LQIFVQGHENLNRAVNDDVVAIEMLPQAQWSCPSSLIMVDEEEKADDDTKTEVQWTRLFTATVVNSHILFMIIGYENIFNQIWF